VSEEFLRGSSRSGVPMGVVWSGTAVARKDETTMIAASDIAGVSYECLGQARGRSGVSAAEIASQLSCCEVLVVTSRYEGFGLPVIEARAVGVPVVCTDIPIHREVADPESTIFFPPGDARALAKILLERLWVGRPRRQSWFRSWMDVARDTAGIIESLSTEPCHQNG
jgi:glycosyltransferase involved in cell wall biosynthesis